MKTPKLLCWHALTVILNGVLLAALLSSATIVGAADPLPSWNDTAPKQAIIAFVEKVTKPGSPHFVPAPERIATFDNDGTLWSEQPMYFQLAFALDRVKALARSTRNGRPRKRLPRCSKAT